MLAIKRPSIRACPPLLGLAFVTLIGGHEEHSELDCPELPSFARLARRAQQGAGRRMMELESRR